MNCEMYMTCRSTAKIHEHNGFGQCCIPSDSESTLCACAQHRSGVLQLEIHHTTALQSAHKKCLLRCNMLFVKPVSTHQTCEAHAHCQAVIKPVNHLLGDLAVSVCCIQKKKQRPEGLQEYIERSNGACHWQLLCWNCANVHICSINTRYVMISINYARYA